MTHYGRDVTKVFDDTMKKPTVRLHCRFSVIIRFRKAGLVVAIGGFFNNLNYGVFSSWMLALFVVGICWIVAACLWYAADKIEMKIQEKKLISQ